ncbi:hypothetical protein KAI04_01785 [Candidatus Pacearchaeota archaeon]|nr:hypothetical protein [Candidatus Pacearchaeota archaeon]
MGVLDQVTQMKNQGVPEKEIINKIQEQGVSPKDINDAMNQSKIKDAVSRPVTEEGMEPSLVGGRAQPAGNSARAQDVNAGVPNDEFYIPQSMPGFQKNQPTTQEYQDPLNQPAQEPMNQPYQEQTYNENYAEPTNYGEQGEYNEEYYPQEGYNEGYENYNSGGTDTMMEIAEQVFSEKIRKIQKQLEDLNEFKTLADTKLTYAINRLKRIEETIDKLQMAILEKVGSYGRGLDSIKKEMSMMQDSFSKTLPVLASHHSRSVHHTPTTKKIVHKKKSLSRKKK